MMELLELNHSQTITKEQFMLEYKRGLLRLQELLRESVEQIDLPLFHDFAPGVYVRTIIMPKGTFVIGKTHKTEHFNQVLAGRATVMMNGEIEEIKAPCTFVSKPGVKKVLLIHEEMVWATIHPTDEKDLVKLEDELVLSDEEEIEEIEKIIKKLESKEGS